MSVTIRPDVETAIIRYLSSKIGARVSGKADRIGKTPCVVVRSTGGEILDPRRSVHQISVSCWGVSPQDDYEAFQLGAKVLQLLEELPISGYVGNYPCHNCRVVVAPYTDPDPNTGISRCSFAIRLHVAGIAI